jgi:hypothetical protein
MGWRNRSKTAEKSSSSPHTAGVLEGMDNGQKTPLGHPNLNSYIQNLLFFCIPDRLVNGRTDRQTDRQRRMETVIRWGFCSSLEYVPLGTPAARGLEELFFRCLRKFSVFWRGWTTDRKLHLDTLILIPTFEIYFFLYSRQAGEWRDRQTDRQTDRQAERWTETVIRWGFCSSLEYVPLGTPAARGLEELFFRCLRKVSPAHQCSARGCMIV